MKPLKQILLAGFIATCLLGHAAGQTVIFTSQFPSEDCHFSTFGGHPYFILNPGHQLILKGQEDGEEKVLTITALDETKEITLFANGSTRKILARVIEERETTDGELAEISRNWYARCVETGDVYYFGEAVDNYEDGMVVNHDGSWEAGVNGALPGILMPGTFMLGARYTQEVALGAALDQAENSGIGLTITNSAGKFENCIQVTEYDGLEPTSDPSIKKYAPGVGLISDDDVLTLTEFNLGKLTGLPRAGTFVPFSNNPFFPFAPGRKLVLEGVEDDEEIVLTITVLDEIKPITLTVGGESKVISTRVIEEQEEIDGELYEVARNFFAQCIETGDVYYFGEEVDFYEDGMLIGHQGAWLAGVNNAQPGIIMPGRFTVGARYFQEVAPGVAEDFGANSAVGVAMTVPAGMFTGCVQVTETNPLDPQGDPEVKTYAPGIGLISDAGILKLTSFSIPSAPAGAPILTIQDAVVLTWPLTDKTFHVESSSDLKIWVPHPQGLPFDGRYQATLLRDATQKFFRLSAQ